MLFGIVFQSVNPICCHRNRFPSEMHPVNSEIIIQSTVINWNKSNRYPELQHLGSKLRSLNFKSKMKREEPNLDIHKNTKNERALNDK